MVSIIRSYDDDYFEDFYHDKRGCKKDHDKKIIECKKIDKKHDCDHKRDHDKRHDDECERDFHRKDDWKDHDKKDDKQDQCFISTHSVGGGETPFFVVTAANTVNQPVFEDLTKNHNKTFLSIRNANNNPPGPGNGNPVSVTITTRGKRCNPPITVTIPSEMTRIFQVEDFESLSVTTQFASTIELVIQKTFCICCKDENNKKHKKHDDCDCDCDCDWD